MAIHSAFEDTDYALGPLVFGEPRYMLKLGSQSYNHLLKHLPNSISVTKTYKKQSSVTTTVTSKALRNSLPFNAKNVGCLLYQILKVNEFPQRQI